MRSWVEFLFLMFHCFLIHTLSYSVWSFVTTSTRTKPCVAGAGNPHGSMRTVTHWAIIYPINAIMMKGSDEVLKRQAHVRSTPYFIRNYYIVALSNPRSLNHFSRECGSPSPLEDHTEYRYFQDSALWCSRRIFYIIEISTALSRLFPDWYPIHIILYSMFVLRREGCYK